MIIQDELNISFMLDRINTIQQTEVLHLKTVRTKLTIANTQKHPEIPTT